MGGSISCICDPSSTIKGQILVMKEDGSLLKFKGGIRVKDILVANPSYDKVIRCCSDKTVLPESFQLCCNQLYFLLPRGPALHDETYDRLLRLAKSRIHISSIVCSGRNDGSLPKETTTETGGMGAEGNMVIKTSDYDDPRYYKSRWKPALQTIPEVKSSPALHFSV
ncbi:hypothetical protein ACH5RR_020524 [Cinchona calisaya]|uniref:Uncharacterized protein n=1 Tax=Cinchona calisaya TaxID=153742 RepID=A0ABD2ZI55_9GENT